MQCSICKDDMPSSPYYIDTCSRCEANEAQLELIAELNAKVAELLEKIKSEAKQDLDDIRAIKGDWSAYRNLVREQLAEKDRVIEALKQVIRAIPNGAILIAAAESQASIERAQDKAEEVE